MAITRKTVEFQAGTRNLFFHILTRCNLKCSHCYINKEQHGTRVLDGDTIAKWLELFLNASRTNVIFLGGEPTLNPALAQGIKVAKRLGYASITVDTNGFLFHNILDRVSPREVDYFSFSLDGSCGEVNDPIRGEGVFSVCVKGIKEAVRKGFAVSSIFTVSRLNIHDLKNMPKLLKELGVSRFFIQVIGIRGKPAESGEFSLQLKVSEWEKIVPAVAEEAAALGLHVTYPKVFLQEDEKFQCAGIVADNFFVFPNGRVYRCPLCEDYPVHAMEIKENLLVKRPPINETNLFPLKIPEGCVLNKMLHGGNIPYDSQGNPLRRIACCMLKEEVSPAS